MSNFSNRFSAQFKSVKAIHDEMSNVPNPL